MLEQNVWCLCGIFLLALPNLVGVFGADDDFNIIQNDGSYQFGYKTPDSYHHSQANRNNVVRGEFGGRNPKTGTIDSVSYTAGPRGFRPKGKNIVRNYDQGQTPRGPIGSPDDPYFDPNEDPSYNFGFKTRTYSRQEGANRVGDVKGRYSFLDDVGERHNVEYIAGKNTGFHVKTPFPDSNPRAYGPLYFRGRGRPIPRGRTSIQRGLDGSYRFVSAGPDQRRTETSDAVGNVRGSYTYLDDKGVQHSVHYIAGPRIGYRVLKNVKGPHLPSIFPFSSPDILPADFYDDKAVSTGDLFDTAATDYQRPRPISGSKPPGSSRPEGIPATDSTTTSTRPTSPKPSFDSGIGGRPTGTAGTPGGTGSDYSNEDDFSDLFGTGVGGAGGSRPASRPGSGGRPSKKPSSGSEQNGSSKPSGSGGLDFGTTGGDGSNLGTGLLGTNTNGGDSFSDEVGDVFGQSSSQGGSGTNGFGNGGSTTEAPTVIVGGGQGSGSATNRPTSRPSGNRPAQGSRPHKPTYDDFDDLDFKDDDLFGGSDGTQSNGKPVGSYGAAKPTSPSDFFSSGGASSGSTDGYGDLSIGGSLYGNRGTTLVTNLGNKYFTIPPGVTVPARVQSIDLYPYESKVPSPTDAFLSETRQVIEKKSLFEDGEDTIIAESNNIYQATEQKADLKVKKDIGQKSEETTVRATAETRLPTTTETPLISKKINSTAETKDKNNKVK